MWCCGRPRLVSGLNGDVLEALAARDWRRAFVDCRDAWAGEIQVLVCGHAILEKFLDPYKAMTAQALLIRVDADELSQPREQLLNRVDRAVAEVSSRGGLLTSPRELSALPLAGLPGWWMKPQDAKFYGDRQVFRPPRPGFRPAPVTALF